MCGNIPYMDPMDIENIFLVNNVNQMRQQFGPFCASFDVSKVDGVSFRPKHEAADIIFPSLSHIVSDHEIKAIFLLVFLLNLAKS